MNPEPNSQNTMGLGARRSWRADERYAAAARFLHWTIAFLIFVQIGLGWWMNEYLPDHSSAQDRVEALHISIGLTILLLVFARIVERIAQPPPPLPHAMRLWERVLARASHLAFYLLMIVLPLTGWAIISVGKTPISFWGLAGWPHLPGLSHLAAPANRPLRRGLKHLHVYVLIWIMLITLGLHLAGTIKAQLSGHPVLRRMLPGGVRSSRKA